ncbi:MAG: SRPBCC domain-containing protein [Deltaproteobacteria bacterium]|jgi:uncharacterized protein YndB with AHSA1/START domain|nr:SRPBCC domain-containing protein [Deltaproteobacteria bacterium]
MDQPQQPGELRYSLDLPAARDDVWELWTVARRLTDWLCASAAVEPTAGGRFLIDWEREPIVGEVLFIDRPRLLLLEWRIDARLTGVEVDLRPSLAGTRVEVTHCGLPDAELREGADRRWQAALERLRGLTGSASL